MVFDCRYFDTGISSVYFFDTEEKSGESFGACFLIHKDVEEKKGGLERGWWDSIHVFEVTEDAKKGTFNYKLTSTVMVSMVIKDATVGQVDLSGNMTKQEVSTHQTAGAVLIRVIVVRVKRARSRACQQRLLTLQIWAACWKKWNCESETQLRAFTSRKHARSTFFLQLTASPDALF